jgi:hypothetical protein
MPSQKRPDDERIDIKVLMVGVQAWPPYPATISDPTPGGVCPVCDRGVNPDDNGVGCLWCDSTSPANEKRLFGARVRKKAQETMQALENKQRSRLETRAQRLGPKKGLSNWEIKEMWYGDDFKAYVRGNRRVRTCARINRLWLKSLVEPAKLVSLGLIKQGEEERESVAA